MSLSGRCLWQAPLVPPGLLWQWLPWVEQAPKIRARTSLVFASGPMTFTLHNISNYHCVLYGNVPFPYGNVSFPRPQQPNHVLTNALVKERSHAPRQGEGKEGAGTSCTMDPSWKPRCWQSSPRLERLLARRALSGSRAPRRNARISGSRCWNTMSPARESRAVWHQHGKAHASCQSPGSPGNRWVEHLPCNATEELHATSGMWLVPLSTHPMAQTVGLFGTFQSSHGVTHSPANTPSVNLKFPHHPDPIPCPN